MRAAPVPVEVTEKGLLREGQPYFIKGVGGSEDLGLLQKLGCNSVRTWSDRVLGDLLDQAQEHGITVCSGIWLESEGAKFSYSNPENCKRQADRVRMVIEKYRDHPAVLLWNIGNESEGDGEDPAYWKQMNALCQTAKAADPHHPTLTAVAGLSEIKAKNVAAYCPDLDLVGINTYRGLHELRQRLETMGWKKPWVVTEFGSAGFWECPKTPWGGLVEQTSTEKARMIQANYERAIAPAGQCAGGYAFLWDYKPQFTLTWFNLRTPDGETTAVVDLLHSFWTGGKPANTAPEIEPVVSSAAQKSVKPDAAFTASVQARDADGDILAYQWTIHEDDIRKDKKNAKIPPAQVLDRISNAQSAEISVKAPEKPGSYRLFVLVKDGKGHAATANIPFRVDP